MVDSVKGIDKEMLSSFGEINLLVGGSPCSDLSHVNPNRRGLNDPSSSGILCYEYHRILREFKEAAVAGRSEFFWLFENTYAMETETREQISSCLVCSPTVRCASAFVPMRRKRNFWGNIPIMYSDFSLPMDCFNLRDFLMPYRDATVDIVSTLTTSSQSQRSGKEKTLPVSENGKGSHLSITEQEVLFGFSPHYTHGPNLSISDGRALLGKAWCVPVICEILRPLCTKFRTRVKRVKT